MLHNAQCRSDVVLVSTPDFVILENTTLYEPMYIQIKNIIIPIPQQEI